jgi:hypothetical protein
MSRFNGAYPVCVGSSISDDPVRWLFVDEGDADDFPAAINERREYPEAWASFEPIAWSRHDRLDSLDGRTPVPPASDLAATVGSGYGSEHVE